MAKKLKKHSIFSVFLAVVLIVPMWPSAVFADGYDGDASVDKGKVSDPSESSIVVENESETTEIEDAESEELEGLGFENPEEQIDGLADENEECVYEREPQAASLTDTVSIGAIEVSYDEAQKTISFLGSGTLSPSPVASNAEIQDWLANAEKVIIGAEITELAAYCFRQDQTGIKLPKCKSMEFLGSDIKMNNFSLREMTLLEDIKLPAELSSISAGCFYGCTALSKIAIPVSVTTIGQQAFLNCTSLETIVNESNESSFPNLMDIGKRAFEGTALRGVISVALMCNIPDGALPATVTVKRDYVTSGIDEASGIKWEVATQGADKILTLEYTGIGTGALPVALSGGGGGIASWLSATDPDVYGSANMTKIVIGEGVVEIPDYCFNNLNNSWKSVRDITVASTVRTIGTFAFRNMDSLRSCTFTGDSALESFGGSVWYECGALESLDLSNTKITSYSQQTYGCTSLTKLAFPTTLKAIEANFLSGNNGVSEIVIPSSVEQIHENAFNASAIKEVVLSCPVVLSGIPSGLHMIYCGLTEAQVREANLLPNDPRYDDALALSEALWNNSALAGNYTLTFQPHQCSAGHALTSGQSVDLTCSACGTGAGVSVEKNGYDYDVKVTAKNMASYLANPVNVYFPDLVNNFATVDGKFYQGVDLADGLRFAKSATVETFKDASGQPVTLTVDGLDEAPGELADHETYGEVDAIKASLLETLGSAEETTAFHHAHLMAGSNEFDFADLPVSSLTFELPFPVDFPGMYDFSVAHMIDSSDHPRLDVGQIETLDASRSNTGIRVTVNSLSPFAVSYAEIPTTEVSTPATPASAGMVGSALSPTGDDAGKPLASLAMLAAAGVLSAAVFEAKRRGALKHFVRAQR